MYSLIILLIASRSSISQKFHFNFCYSYFGILSSLIMTFMSHLINYTFTLVLIQQFQVHKFMISQFHLQNTTMALGAHMRPLQLHVLYTFSGRGVTPNTEDFSDTSPNYDTFKQVRRIDELDYSPMPLPLSKSKLKRRKKKES